jgi:hypothetical protein
MFTPSEDTIKGIYGNILKGHLSSFNDENLINMVPLIIDAKIYYFNKLLKDTSFSPSAKKFFY